MLLLWAVPGMFVLALVRRDVRSILGLTRSARTRPPDSVRQSLADVYVGGALYAAILVAWPVVLLCRRWVAQRCARHPRFFIRQAYPKGATRALLVTLAVALAVSALILLILR